MTEQPVWRVQAVFRDDNQPSICESATGPDAARRAVNRLAKQYAALRLIKIHRPGGGLDFYNPAGEYMFGLSAEGIDQIAKAYAEDE